MPKLFTKKQFFAFLASFFITFFAGIFAWFVFFNADNIFNQVLSRVDKIGAMFFEASITPDIAPATNSQYFDELDELALTIDEAVADDTNPGDYTGTGGIDIALLTGEEKQELLDDIQEKLDIMAQQVAELAGSNNITDDSQEIQDENNNDEEITDEQSQPEINLPEANQNSGGGTKPIYPKILISEVQIAGQADEKQEFIELYNPNNTDVDLSGWYLQKKTAESSLWSTYAANNLFSEKRISANGYFVIARAGYFMGLADVFTDNSITENNSFALKDPNGDISDKLGFGQAQDPELSPVVNPADGQTAGRKVLNDGTEKETGNNSFDFELQIPTPKAKNITYIQPISSGTSGSGGGSVTPVAYPKILISEVQIAGQADEKEEFVELYNPNNADVDLTDWYLQRKTAGGSSWSTYASNNLFSGKTISASSYFLVARTGYYTELADIFTDNAITDNNAFALKNPNSDISDELLATVSPSLAQTIGRKILSDNTEQDTDNNFEDFEIQMSTPKAQNITFIVPPAEPPVELAEEKDTAAPDVSFTLDANQNSLTFPINFEITDLLGMVTPSGIESYIFQWQKDGDADWQQDAPVLITGAPVVATSTIDFTGEDETTYNFQIKVKDVAENESTLPAIPAMTKISIPKKVLINEVQINNDEFVELYNYGEDNLNLSNLYFSYFSPVINVDESPKYNWNNPYRNKSFFESKQTIIPAGGYYLIGLQGYPIDKGNPNADWQPYTSDQLNNSSGTIAIFPWDPKTKTIEDAEQGAIDTVGWGDALIKNGNSAPVPPMGKSIERKELGLDTDDNSQDFVISEMPTPMNSAVSQ